MNNLYKRFNDLYKSFNDLWVGEKIVWLVLSILAVLAISSIPQKFNEASLRRTTRITCFTPSGWQELEGDVTYGHRTDGLFRIKNDKKIVVNSMCHLILGEQK